MSTMELNIKVTLNYIVTASAVIASTPLHINRTRYCSPAFSLCAPTFYLRIYTASPGYTCAPEISLCLLVYSLGHSLIKNNTLYGGIKVELSHSLSRTRVASASAWITTGHRRTHPLHISALDQLDPKTICQAQIT
jgi:hypothetical protein